MSLTCTKFHIDTVYRSKDMMILVNCGCCGVASGYGCAVWCGTHGATGVQGTVLYEGNDVRPDGERFCFTSRSWFGVCGVRAASPKYRAEETR